MVLALRRTTHKGLVQRGCALNQAKPYQTAVFYSSSCSDYLILRRAPFTGRMVCGQAILLAGRPGWAPVERLSAQGDRITLSLVYSEASRNNIRCDHAFSRFTPYQGVFRYSNKFC